MQTIVCGILAFALVACVAGSSCSNYVVSSSSASSGAANMYKETSFLVQFTLECDGQQQMDLQLMAQIGDDFVPVTLDDDGNFQVSWHVPHKIAVSGGATVKIFDEEGYPKAQRALRNGETTDGLEAFTVSSNYKAPLNLKLPIAPQFIAMACFGYAAFYLFLKTRNVD